MPSQSQRRAQMASSVPSTATPPAPPAHPRPKGRAPTNHSWDTAQGVYVHDETGAIHNKGDRSAASATKQSQRKRGEQPGREREQASGAAHRKDAAIEAERRDKNRRRNVVNQHRRAAREKAVPPLDACRNLHPYAFVCVPGFGSDHGAVRVQLHDRSFGPCES